MRPDGKQGNLDKPIGPTGWLNSLVVKEKGYSRAGCIFA